MGREWEIRLYQRDIEANIEVARKAGDADNVPLSFGQDAGLIKDIAPVKDIVRQIVKEAESIISNKLPSLME